MWSSKLTRADIEATQDHEILGKPPLRGEATRLDPSEEKRNVKLSNKLHKNFIVQSLVSIRLVVRYARGHSNSATDNQKIVY